MTWRVDGRQCWQGVSDDMAISEARGNRRVVVAGIICAVAVVVVVAVALVLIRGLGGSGATATDSGQVALAKLAWCDQPAIQFQDNSTTNQTVLTKWEQVKDQLNFTPYLPPTLPKGSCLALAGGAIHDTIFGGRMSITYELPDGTPVSLSEAPKRGSLGDSLQCQPVAASPTAAATAGSATATTTVTATTTATPRTTVCIGAVANTTVTIASRQSESDVRALFKTLKPNVDWVPAAGTATATPSATATATASK